MEDTAPTPNVTDPGISIEEPVSTVPPPPPRYPLLIPISILALVFSISIAILLFFQYSRLQKQSSQTQAPVTPVPTVSQSPVPTTDPTANWKTYTSTAFSFKYDPNLYFDQLTTRDTEVTLYNKDPRLSNQKNVYYLGFVSTQNTTFNKQINLIKQGNQNITYTSNKLNGYTIYEVKGIPSPGGVNEIEYFIEGNNILTEVHIGNIADVKEPEYVQFLDSANKILSTFKFTDNGPTPTSAPKTTKLIRLYPFPGANLNQSINKIHIISVLFVPKGINTSIKPEWNTNLTKINTEIKSFFEKQFANNIQITYQTTSQPIMGDSEIESYTHPRLVTEATTKTQNYDKSDSYNIRMVYLVRDPEYKRNPQGNGGGLPSQQAATQDEFWLDNDAVNSSNQYGVIGSAHEFAHSLGIPHPWELPSNTNNDPNYGNVAGDLMGYQNRGKLQNLYLRDDVKKIMGL